MLMNVFPINCVNLLATSFHREVAPMATAFRDARSIKTAGFEVGDGIPIGNYAYSENRVDIGNNGTYMSRLRWTTACESKHLMVICCITQFVMRLTITG